MQLNLEKERNVKRSNNMDDEASSSSLHNVLAFT